MATVNGISDLPGIPQPAVDPDEASSSFLARYFGGYEHQLALAIERPVKVRSVSREDHDAGGRLRITTSRGDWSARAIINATGTWTRPFWPIYPGQASFRGRQLHVADYVSAEEFRGLHVIVVGGGISAVGLLERSPRSPPPAGSPAGNPSGGTPPSTGRPGTTPSHSSRSACGGPAAAKRRRRDRPDLDPCAARGRRPGVLERRPMFTGIEPGGVRMADGNLLAADVILWATGFRAELEHLAPLHLRGPGGGIAMDGTQVAAEPRVHLVGYGPSSSTIGANRAGRAAVAGILRLLGEQDKFAGDLTSGPEHPEPHLTHKRRQLARGGQHS